MLRVEVEPKVEIAVQDLGEGRPVVLVHGWGMSHEAWDRPVRALLDGGRRVVTIDLRGHGASSKPAASYDLERLAEDLIEVLDTLGLTNVDLVGWSLGGMICFRVATLHPERVGRLVLVASNGVASVRHEDFPYGPPIEGGLAMIDGELADRFAFRRALFTSQLSGSRQDGLVDWLLHTSMQMPSWAGAACLQTLLTTNQTQAAASLSVPLVQIFGELDGAFSTSAAKWLMQNVPVSHQIPIAEAGHFPMFEAPEQFERALTAALAE